MAVPKKRKSKTQTSIKKQCWKKRNENQLKNVLTLYFKTLSGSGVNNSNNTGLTETPEEKRRSN